MLSKSMHFDLCIMRLENLILLRLMLKDTHRQKAGMSSEFSKIFSNICLQTRIWVGVGHWMRVEHKMEFRENRLAIHHPFYRPIGMMMPIEHGLLELTV